MSVVEIRSRRDTTPGWPIERAMLDYWARWLRRNRYLGAPATHPKCNIGKVMDLGMPTGPTRYSDEAVDVDEEAEIVQQFMLDQMSDNHRIYRALVARHLRELIDEKGIRHAQDGAKEKDMAPRIYGGSVSAAVRRMQRDCNEGYERLYQFSRCLDSFVMFG